MTKFYQVGGSVRDSIMGIKSKDIDYAVETESFDSMRQAIIARGGKIFVETPQYFTIRANVPDLGATDYVLCRKDGEYKDGRRPETVMPGTIYDDLARRDFTMNAIAIDIESGVYLDPHEGKKDIEAGIIRCVGNVDIRFNEDRLRVFRALRFSVTKRMSLDEDISFVMSLMKPEQFTGVSTERIRDEVFKMFAHDSWASMNEFQRYANLWKIVEQRGIWLMATSRTT